jgi:serine protease inhibitor
LPDLNNWENKFRTDINLYVPKFDVQSKLDLKNGLKKMGVSDCFNSEKADFSPITDLQGEISQMLHGARAKIDEDGIEAAAYTTALRSGSANIPVDEIDFKLDRPFIFVIKGVDGLPLFVGTVNNP